MFSETGKKLVELIELSIESFKSINKDANDLNDPLLQVRNFGEIIDKIKGYDYEDYITSLIKEKLATLETKQKILIIDDLDRFDPEHLFRLISIFSTHIDHQTNENKFGFDKIIFVGDLQNIKEMFEHK